jgi:hypothetical protein
MVDRFWVSPLEASFDSTFWSAVSGGDPGASVPDSTDFAYFNSSGVGDCLIDGTTSVYGIELGSGYSGSVYPSGSCEVQKSLVLNGGHLRDGTINVYGDVCCNLGFGSFTTNYNASVKFKGTDKQNLFSNGGIFHSIEIEKNNTSNQVKTFGDYPIYFNGDFYIHDGTFHTNGHDIISGPSIVPNFFDVDFDWEIL